MDKTKFDLKYLFFGEGAKDWYKAIGNGWRIFVLSVFALLLIAGFLWVKNFLFPKPGQNINKPSVVALPGSKIEKVDQTSTQVLMEEKAWEAAVGGGVMTFDNKAGTFLGGWVKRKW